MIVANHFRQADEDPYRQAFPAPPPVREPDSLWEAALFVAIGIGWLVLIAWSEGAFDSIVVAAQSGAGR